VDKANRYSSLQVADLAGRRASGLRLRMLTNAWAAFFRYYLLRGHYRSGWAGFIAARIHAFYAFLKYAKLYEATRAKQKETRIPAPERKDV